ncbi:rhamnulokinase [Candidatus Poribacteria bacterium]|nr:rhamnulokinase [Candidatus Poribacteria bacterium]
MQEKFLAFDLGASSGRAVLGTLKNNRLVLEEIHRFTNGPVAVHGTLYWDVLRLFDEMQQAMSLYVHSHGRELSGIGVDTWGVDFGLLSRDGALISNPVHYRDKRTDGMMEEVFKRVPREEVYNQTGIQFMQLNTLYQLFSLVLNKSPLLEVADTLLMMPDLFNYFLTGAKSAEFTEATTSQFYNPRSGAWAMLLLEKLGIPAKIMPEIVPPGTILSKLSPHIAEEVGLVQVNVVAPACHDTGSAVAAVPAERDDWAYISSGTWSLIGIEVQEPIINEQSLQFNFTNEGGVGGTYRFLRNVAGLWLVQECRRIWERSGQSLSYQELVRLAAEAKPFIAFVDPDHNSFLNPPDMPAAIVEFCERTGQTKPATKGEIVRCALESLALKYRAVLEMISQIRGPIKKLHIVGGGTQNTLLCQFTANATNVPVIAGPVEATAIGNIMVQAIALGCLPSIAEGRRLIRQSFDLVEYQPQEQDAWDEAYQRFVKI